MDKRENISLDMNELLGGVTSKELAKVQVDEWSEGKEVKPHLAGRPIQAAFGGPMTQADLLRLQATRGQLGSTNQRELKKIRNHHHRIAKMLAKGVDHATIAEQTGMTIQRVTVLACDPSMAELVAHYGDHGVEIVIDMHEQYRATTGIALEELQDRLEEQPEEFTAMQLLDVVERLGDRCGMGPKSSLDAKVAIGVGVISDSILEQVKGAVNVAAKGRVFQGQTSPSNSLGVEVGTTPSSIGEAPRELQGPKPLPAEGVAVSEESAEEAGEIKV